MRTEVIKIWATCMQEYKDFCPLCVCVCMRGHVLPEDKAQTTQHKLQEQQFLQTYLQIVLPVEIINFKGLTNKACFLSYTLLNYP
jgi:hypothetical protein